MIILHQRMRAKPDRCDEVVAALDAIVGARATEGVFKLDIARDLLDPGLFIATGVYENGAALERQVAPELFTELLPDYPLRRKLPFLTDDLLALGEGGQ